jgi:transposase
LLSGERADDPLYLPCIEPVRASLDRRGLLYVGDAKMAARQTRATIAAGGDYYLCPLSSVQQFEGALEAALEPVWRGEQVLTPVRRESAKGESELIAEGYEYPVIMRHQVGKEESVWEERCLVVRSLRHAAAAEAALLARVSKGTEQIRALNQRGRGKQRFETMAALRRAGVAILKRHDVGDVIRFRLHPHVEARSVRAYRGQAARVEQVRDTTVEVEVDEAALTLASRRLGWRLYATNQGAEQLSIEQAVLAYRNEYQVERSLGRLKGRPLSLTPLYMQRDDHATGLIRLLSVALRVLTLLAFVVRRQLTVDGTKLAGLYAGNAKRETARPTAERLLDTFQDITVTIIQTAEQTIGHVTALHSVQQRILELLGFSAELYTALAAISPKPP